MSNPTSSESVSLLIQQKIKPDAVSRYEKWLGMMVAKAAEHEGHQGVHIIRPPAGGTEYSIIIRYASFASAESWTKSQTRKQLIAEISDAFDVPDKAQIHPGIEFWFTPASSGQKRPTGWKQWVVTTSVIWPLSLLVPPLYAPLFRFVPELGHRGVREGIVSGSIVALVVFFIMPYYVRLVARWLYR